VKLDPRPLWRRWVALLDRREDAASLAICRIVAGSVVLHHLLVMAWTGVGMAVWVDKRFGGVRSLDPGLLSHVGGCTPLNVGLLLGIAIVASAFLTAGLFTRWAAVLTWFAFRTLSVTNDQAGGASDDLLINVLFLLMLSDSGGALSLDARRRGGPRDAPAWPRYLIVGQLALMYWMTALQKVSAGWIPGGPADALWYILQQPTWQRIDMRWAAPLYPLTQIATIVTWLFEQSAPLFLLAFWFRLTRERPGRVRAFFNRIDFRRCYLLLGFVLHLGIWSTMEVGPFLGAVLSCYACCVTPAEWRRFLAWSSERLRTGARGLPAASGR
jgi:hypothetical protein